MNTFLDEEHSSNPLKLSPESLNLRNNMKMEEKLRTFLSNPTEMRSQDLAEMLSLAVEK